MAGDPAAGVEALAGHPRRPRSAGMGAAAADVAADEGGEA